MQYLAAKIHHTWRFAVQFYSFPTSLMHVGEILILQVKYVTEVQRGAVGSAPDSLSVSCGFVLHQMLPLFPWARNFTLIA